MTTTFLPTAKNGHLKVMHALQILLKSSHNQMDLWFTDIK